MTQWQPIETAPKDGTSFLGWHPNDDRYFREQIKETWMGKAAEGSIAYARWLDGESPRNTGWEYISGDCLLEWKPTHWMPLPQPPEAAE